MNLIICPECNEETTLEVLHNATEVWSVEIVDGVLDYNYLDTFHDGSPDPTRGDVIECRACGAQFIEDEVIQLLGKGVA